ncbi:MAG: S24 family peptidase [Butyricimonas virosa]|uniref:S24 family peptidase n=1 Tax=Butyricimonas virosa TaxID=544645 RepID=UPI002A91DDE1|nr:S24 family peptidase [Butyricimonas virosa]MDY5533781.1 S24 family peptidase [Butyricimonas virosa]
MRKIDRFDKYMAFKELNDNKVTIQLGLSIGTLGKSRKEGRDLSDRVIEQILNFYTDLNKIWLLTGEGKMLKDDTEIPHMEVLSVGIPHIESVEAYCGPGQGFDVAVMRKECPMYNIPGMEGADFTIKAKGRSMINREYPDRSVKEGDYIGCVKCRSGVIRFGEVYALATSEGIMVKIVQESDREGYVLLESFNKEEGFKPFHYPIVDIHDMALVVAVASINRWA